MMSLAKWLIATILATSFDTSVQAQTTCFADGKCSVSSNGFLDLRSCDIIDSDIDGLATCIDDAGRSSILILSISDNMLTAIPSNLFEGLSALETLSLESNQLTALPFGFFAGLGVLTDLKLDANQLTTLPLEIFAGLEALEYLSISDNMFTAIPSYMFEGISVLETLYLDGNQLTTLPSGVFAGVGGLKQLKLDDNQLTTLPSDVFAGLEALEYLSFSENMFTAIPSSLFEGLSALETLSLYGNQLTTLPSGVFAGLVVLDRIELDDNKLTTLPSDVFAGLEALEELYLYGNLLTTLPSGIFAGLEAMVDLEIDDNQLTTLPSGVFDGMEALEFLFISVNALTTLPAGLFENLSSGVIFMDDNPDLQCFPSFSDSGTSTASGGEVSSTGCCECTGVATCDGGLFCNPGLDGYTCDATEKSACGDGNECEAAGEECCASCNVCEASADIDAGACGDPHMTGFRGQKFDFTGEDNAWYAVVSDPPHMHLNMRVTSPVPSVPEITYITGISIVTTDTEGLDHTIVISVKNPHSMESSCADGLPSCLADGAVHVVVDGEELMISPGEVTVAPGVAIGAVNLPGACRSFGFEKYWERKVELLSQAGRRLSLDMGMQDMSDWVLADPTATNMVECAEYVAEATAGDGLGLFAHHSEHASFQIMTPTATIRLSHGRLHQLPMRDPTDQFDLPDHLTWQMNLAVDHADMSLDATGILGETFVPTRDEHGAPIMQGMGAIRGDQEDYRVGGPLDIFFSQGQHHE